MVERDRRDGRDTGWFEVRSSRFWEHRTQNFKYRTARSIVFAFPLFIVALTCTIAFGSSGQTSETPTEAVRSTLTEVFRILEDETLKDPSKLIPRRVSFRLQGNVKASARGPLGSAHDQRARRIRPALQELSL